MNLIEQLGGYSAAKAEANAPVKLLNSLNYEELDKQLLQYRRQHNIFEDGDLVVFKTLGDGHVHKFSEFHEFKYDLRHATDAEIKAGKRL